LDMTLDCLPCNLRQVLEASRLATDDMEIQEVIMKEAVELIADYKSYKKPPSLGRELHKLVYKHTGILDPYKRIKEENISKSLEIFPKLQRFLSKKDNKLYWALKIAATGNIIDLGVYSEVDIEESIIEELAKEFAVCNINKFEKELKHAKNILIIGDNAGETVFDRILIEELGDLDVTYAVRSGPVINDATIEDARASGLEECTRLISTGCDAPGTLLDECSDEFLEIFHNADMVISKGQGNYETLIEEQRGLFFLLKAKCPVNADSLKVNINDYVFKWNGQ
jgi:uncharacterized protein with ATP-grasp and redox domains